MNAPTKTDDVAARPKATTEEKRARLKAAEQKRQTESEDRRLDAEIERLELVERFERELGGREGAQFAIYDATELGEGFFVVKLGESILMKTFMDSEMTDVDRCDFVTPCVVHPEKATYLAARGRRPGIDVELSNRLAKLYGLQLKVEGGK